MKLYWHFVKHGQTGSDHEYFLADQGRHRKELARELGYTGNTADSAAMNVWLHKQVMKQLAANGGKVPAELKD